MTSRKAKPTPADQAAAARLKAAWQARARGLGLTQESFAAERGMSQGAVSQYLGGKIPMNYRTLLQFCNALGIAPETIRYDLPEQRLTARMEGASVAEPVAPYVAKEPSQQELDEMDDALIVIRAAAQFDGTEPNYTARSIHAAHAVVKERGERVTPQNLIEIVKAFLDRIGGRW